MNTNAIDERVSLVPAWGKLRQDPSGRQERHALIDHMLDVAAVFAELAHGPAVRRAMERTAQRLLDDVDLARLATLAFLHDIGKANAGFQAKQWRHGATDGAIPPGWPWPAGHGNEAWALVKGQQDRLSGALPLHDIAAWGTAAGDLLQASISHHGRPVASPDLPVHVIWRPVHAPDGTLLYDPWQTLGTIGRCARHCFPRAFELPAKPLPDTPAFAHLFAGLVQLADWLGSDTRFFDYTQPGEDRALTAPALARSAVQAIGLNSGAWRQMLQHRPPAFARVFDLPAPRPIQTALADPALGPLVILEAQTGNGKTEAALWRFTRLFQAGAVDSLYFALPTRVAASQVYERVRSFVQGLWPAQACAEAGIEAPVAVRALPGYEAADGQHKTSLPAFQVLWADQPADNLAHRRWAAEAPKRFLAATIAIGTIDQVLLAALKVRHAHLRHALLSRSLLVVDEVHASDAYMNVLMERLLRAHLHAGGHALLLSATLGAASRARFAGLAASPAVADCPPLAVARDWPYPCVSTVQAARPATLAVPGDAAQKTVHWRTLDAIDDPARIALLAAEAARQGARVLVIRNTVPAAVATLRAVEQQQALEPAGDWLFKVHGVSTLHHSRFSRQDRPLLDAQVDARLGKDRRGASGCVLVGTQTLEQSLDIDADLLITDLCPMDVLLQRLGRLHRHARAAHERPAGFAVARAWVMTPPGHDLAPLLARSRHGLGRLHSGGGIYPDLRMLEATRRLVDAQPTRDIPRHNRVLVEDATHPEALLAIESELGTPWQALGQAIEGEVSGKRSLGHLQGLPYERAFCDVQFPDDDEKIATRLGAADRLIELDPPLPGPFGQAVRQLALRHHLAPEGLSPDAKPQDIVLLPQEGGFEFSLGNTRYRYSRLGLERLPASRPQGERA